MLQLWLLRQLFDYREKVLWLREYELITAKGATKERPG